jgi:hypothetical protein
LLVSFETSVTMVFASDHLSSAGEDFNGIG